MGTAPPASEHGWFELPCAGGPIPRRCQGTGVVRWLLMVPIPQPEGGGQVAETPVRTTALQGAGLAAVSLGSCSSPLLFHADTRPPPLQNPETRTEPCKLPRAEETVALRDWQGLLICLKRKCIWEYRNPGRAMIGAAMFSLSRTNHRLAQIKC